MTRTKLYRPHRAKINKSAPHLLPSCKAPPSSCGNREEVGVTFPLSPSSARSLAVVSVGRKTLGRSPPTRARAAELPLAARVVTEWMQRLTVSAGSPSVTARWEILLSWGEPRPQAASRVSQSVWVRVSVCVCVCAPLHCCTVKRELSVLFFSPPNRSNG